MDSAVLERALPGASQSLPFHLLAPQPNIQQSAERAPSFDRCLQADPAYSLVGRRDDGTLAPHGAVQLLDPAVAAAYGAYLHDLAAHLRDRGLYETVTAVHLEMGDWAELPESVQSVSVQEQLPPPDISAELSDRMQPLSVP